ncbi:MAG: cytochrome c peroxidase [Candidatus Sericytochromatia bacterium]|nr:cytochrome c peroxidase [Candidatus Sericytochromatia bacterium]
MRNALQVLTLVAWVGSSLLTGCQVSRLPAASGNPTLEAVRVSDPAGTALPAGTGGVRVGVRWPQRQTQVIPADIASLTLKARDGSGGPPVVLTLVREGSEALATGSLQPLEPGTVSISAEALSASGGLLATGSTEVVVQPNTLTQAVLTLQNIIPVTIFNVDPKQPLPGQQLSISGQGFGWTSRLPVEVRLNGQPLPPSAIATRSDTALVVTPPEDFTSGTLSVDVAGQANTYRPVITRIASISIDVLKTAAHAPGGIIELRGKAYDSTGKPLDPLALAPHWSRRCNGADCGANLRLKELFVQGGGCLVLPESTGTIAVRLGNDQLQASLSFEVHAFGRADLAQWNMGPMPAITPVPSAEFALGERLFGDPTLSSNGKMSCASCHQDALGGGDGLKLGIDKDGKELPRHVPTIWNTAFNTLFNWDGSADSLEAQHLLVFTRPREFATTGDAVTATLRVSNAYVQDFQAVYGSAPDDLLARKAVAAYVRAHVSPAGRNPDNTPNPTAAPFDRWVLGDDNAMTADQIRGLAIFTGKANCAACHNGPLFTDNKFHNIGFDEFGTGDPGRRGVTGLATDQGAFKTPGLRNVAQTAPYFHNGSQPDLFSAVHFYERFATKAVNIAPEMRQPPDMKTDPDGPGPAIGEWDALIAFHHALTATVSPVIAP